MKKFTILLVVCLFSFLNQANSQTFINYDTLNSGLASNNVSLIAIDTDGNKWFGCRRYWHGDSTQGGVSKFDGTNWITYTTDNGLVSNEVYAIAIDEEGNKWIGTDGGVSKFDDTTWTTYTTEDGLAGNWVVAIAIDSEGNKWFGIREDAGVSKFNDTTWTTYTTEDGLASNDVRDIAIDAEGNKWFGTFGGGVSKFDGTYWTTYDTLDGLAYNYVNAIAIDKEGNKWFGTCYGVSKFDDTNWTTYRTSEGLASNWVNEIAIDAEGNKWFGSEGGGSIKFDDSKWTNIPGVESVCSIAVDDSNHIWMACYYIWCFFQDCGMGGPIESGLGVTKLDEEGTPQITIFPGNLDVSYEAGDTTFTVTSNTSWTVSYDADWLLISSSRGIGNYTITINLEANNSTSSRVATIIISGLGKSDSVTVTQDGFVSVPSLYDLYVSIYPNPAKDNLFIKLEDALFTDISISVIDICGRRIIQRNFESTDLDTEGTLDLSTIKSGIYFLEIRSARNSRVFKIIKE